MKLGGSQQARGQKSEGCDTAHPEEGLSPQHSVPGTSPTGSGAKGCGKKITLLPCKLMKSGWASFCV